MSTYVFKFKKKFFWHRIRKVIGHKLENDIMVVYFENGGLRTIREWHKYELELNGDWANCTKKKMEKESGLNIRLATE